MSAESAAEPLLSLDTLIVRPEIEIDGTRYQIRSPGELSVLESRQFGLWTQQLQDLQAREGEVPELETLVATMAAKVAVGVPPEILVKLSGSAKVAVVEVFTALLLRRRMGVAGAAQKAMGDLSIGASSFPGFSDFTAAPRGSGWRKRLSRWFRLT